AIDNDNYSNKIVADAMFFTILMSTIVWVLNKLDIFILEKGLYTACYIITTLLFSVPIIVVKVLKRNSSWVKYVILSSVVVSVGVFYMIAGYHSNMLFFLPLILASLYSNAHFISFISLMTVQSIILSHVFSIHYSALPDPPTSLYDVLVYDAIPKLMIFLTISVITYISTKRSSATLNKVWAYSFETTKNKDSLDIIIAKSRSLNGTYDMLEFSNLALNALRAVVATQLVNQRYESDPYGIVGYRTEDNRFQTIDEFSKEVETTVINDTILVNLPNERYSIPLTKEDIHNNILVTDDLIQMLFYDKQSLSAFFVFVLPITAEKQALRDILGILYSNIKLSLTNNKLNGDMFKNQVELVHAFAEISESKSKQTGQHVKRVSEYMRILGDFYGYGKHDCDNLSIASMMHDVGKLLIPEEILEKPGKLTKEEFETIKLHTVYGQKLLENAPGEIMQ
ncbi:MAG: HD domain-containing protein, partial [Oscillospiraceae bacterium]